MKGRPAWNKGKNLEYEELEKHLERTKNRKQMSPETRAKWIANIASKATGSKRSKETKMKMSLASKGKLKGPQSEEHKLAISVAGKGIKKKEGHSTNVANAVLGNISINKDNVEKKVKKDVLQSYLDDGWQLGGKKRKSV
jgi:hypothetical protein